jgi:hypothetical protein
MEEVECVTQGNPNDTSATSQMPATTSLSLYLLKPLPRIFRIAADVFARSLDDERKRSDENTTVAISHHVAAWMDQQ